MARKKQRMRILLCSSFIAALLLTPGCARREEATKTAGQAASETATKKPSRGEGDLNKDGPIGTATMAKDGTIILDLRAEGSNGTIGDGRLIYQKDDKEYSEVLKHLGGLKPGEFKPVPPWPDKQ